MPITWKNVNSPSPTGISSLMQGAREGVTDVSDAFTGVIEDRQKRQSANRENTIDNNTQSFLNDVRGMSLEELNQAQETGSINQRLDSYGNMIDQEQTAGVLDQQIRKRREQEIAGNTYEDQQLAREQDPIMNEAMKLALDGNMDGARELGAQLTQGRGVELEGQLRQIEDQNRHRKEQTRMREADQLQNTMLDRTNQNQQQANEKLTALGNEYGLEMVNGRPDTSGMTEDKHKQFLKDAEGIEGAGTDTEIMNNFRQQMRDLNLSSEQQAVQEESMRTRLELRDSLEPEQQQEVEQQMDQQQQLATEALAEVDREFEADMARNPWIQEKPEDPVAERTRIMEDLVQDPEGEFAQYWFNDDTDRKAINNTMDELLSGGQEVTLADGSKENIHVPADIVRSAVVANINSSNPARAVKKDVEASINNNRRLIQESTGRRQRYQDEKAEINRQNIRSSAAIRARVRANSGLKPQRVSDWKRTQKALMETGMGAREAERVAKEEGEVSEQQDQPTVSEPSTPESQGGGRAGARQGGEVTREIAKNLFRDAPQVPGHIYNNTAQGIENYISGPAERFTAGLFNVGDSESELPISDQLKSRLRNNANDPRRR